MADPGELKRRLEAFCAARTGRPVCVRDLVRLSGGASRETWSFVLEDGPARRRLVLRQDPEGAPPRTGRRREVALLERAARAGVPVPRVVWTAEPGELGGEGFIMEHVDGETIPRRILRDDAFARARRLMAAQCGTIAARIHAIDPEGLGLQAPARPPAEATLEEYRALLDALGEPHPVFELAMRILEDHLPPSPRLVVVHGDFRNGNFIVGEDGIRAVLDWEIAHLGDPWEDLAWLCLRSWRFGARGEVGGFGDREDLYRAYQAESGLPVDDEAVRWWEAMSNVKWGVMTIMQAFTHLWGHVRSLELAAIGRRTVETEYDVLGLLRSFA